MRPLSTYIEYLLMTQHYAFLPGLGGFVMADHEAKFKSGILLAPGRTVQFNRFMTHDDGQLADVIMEDTGMNYDEAMQRIRHEVATMLDKVQHEGRCSLGHLGYLFSDEECHVSFRPADTQKIDPLYYGHENIRIRPWKEIEEERSIPAVPAAALEEKNDFIKLPKYWLHRAAIVILIVCFFFGNLITGNRTSSDQYASMLDTEAIMSHFSTLESQSWDESWESENYEIATAAESTETAEDAVEEAAAPVVAESAMAEAAPAVVEAPVVVETPAEVVAVPQVAHTEVAASEKRYYIIIASTTSSDEAQRVLKKFAKKGYENVDTIERDGRIRLYIDSFTIKSEAESYLQQLRQNELFEKAWLLSVKNQQNSSVLSCNEGTPLQLIIKEKDNDHVFMELSHLNTTAERDQG